MTIFTMVLALLLVPLSAKPRQLATNEFSQFDHWRKFLSEHPKDMRAAIALWNIEHLISSLDTPHRNTLLELLKKLSSNTRAPLALRRLASRMLAERFSAMGKEKAAEKTRRKLGWINRWWIVGPFPDDIRDGFSKPFGPEDNLDLHDSYKTKSKEISWRPLAATEPDGRVLLHPLFNPSNSSVAYALSILELKHPAMIVLHAGCDDACKVWINNTLVISDKGPHDLRADQHSVSMWLPAGANRILVKVVQDNGVMGFWLGITSPKGKAVPGAQVITEQSLVDRALKYPLPEAPSKVKKVQTLSEWFRAAMEKEPENPRALAEASLAFWEMSSTPRLDQKPVDLLTKALQLLPDKDKGDELIWRIWLARISSDEQETKDQLQLCTKLADDDPMPLTRLGLYHQARGESLLALDAYNKAVRMAPNYPLALTGRAEILLDLGLYAQSEAQMDRIFKARSDIPEVCMSAGAAYRRMNLSEKARKAFEQLVSLDAHNELGQRALYELAIERGDLKGALSYSHALLASDPLRISWILQLSRLLEANGKTTEALAAVDYAKELNPDLPSVYTTKGEILLDFGSNDEALAQFGKALSLTPQDRALANRMQALHPSGPAFYAPWSIDGQSLVTEALKSPKRSGARRLRDIRVTKLHPNGMASRFHQQIVRVYDSRGVDQFRTFRIEYSPGRQEVRVVNTRLWHADGTSDRSILLDDTSLSEPWYNLYYDIHAREITFPDLRPGDLIEVSTILEDSGDSALLGDYFGDLVQLQYSESLDEGLYVILIPKGRSITSNKPGGNVIYSQKENPDGSVTKIWKAKDIPAVSSEPGMPGFTQTHIYLHISTMKSWSRLSRWFGALVADHLKPCPQSEYLAKELTQGMEEPIEKIRAIYRYVADNTRYVGLEFGIHSYIPYPSNQVIKRKFGDCKDKSALLVSMLESIGIRANLALIRMRRLGKFDGTNGPASLAVFNHAICYVPDYQMWLDGTAALNDIDDLPPQDQGTQALVISPEGGGLRITPTSGSKRNWTHLDFDIYPKAGQRADLEAKLSFSGVLAPEVRLRLLSGSSKRQALAGIMEEIFPGVEVKELTIEDLQYPSVPIRISSKMSIPCLGQNRDGLLDLPALGKTTGYQRMLASLQRRQYDLELGPAWTVKWKVTIHPPKDFYQMDIPEPQKVKSKFGQANIEFHREESSITTSAEFELTTDIVNASEYGDFRKFLGKVDQMFSVHLQFRSGNHGSI